MPSQFNDGNVPFGTTPTTINGTDYVVEEVEFEEKSTATYRRDGQNVPNGAIYTSDLIKGKMTLQLAANDTPVPENQSLCTLSFRGSDKQFVITNVSQPQKQDEIHKIKMEITEVLNPT